MTDERRPTENEGGGSGKIPNQRELEKELSEYLSKKYGSRVKIISPFFFPIYFSCNKGEVYLFLL